MSRFLDLSRRDLLRLSAAGVLGTSVSGWFNVLANRAARPLARESSTSRASCCGWPGGPAQSHTLDVKPGSDFKPISTAVPGIQISEHLPKTGRADEAPGPAARHEDRRRQSPHRHLSDAHRLPQGGRRGRLSRAWERWCRTTLAATAPNCPTSWPSAAPRDPASSGRITLR